MANRFWVGGTGTWDASDTTNWSTSNGGAGGASVPTSADTVTFNNNSGGGTVTVNTTVSVISITADSFAGTLDFATNDNNVNLSLAGIAFSMGGAATQTLNMGDGTWTFTGTVNGNMCNFAGSGLTLNANGSTMVFSGSQSTGERGLLLGARTYNNITLSGAGSWTATASFTISGTLTQAPGTNFRIQNSPSIAAVASTATLSSPASLNGSTGQTATIGGNGTFTVSNMAFRDVNFSGGNTRTANDSFNQGNVTGITVNPPSGGGGSTAARVIGG